MKYVKYILTAIVVLVLLAGLSSPYKTTKTEYLMDTLITITTYGFGNEKNVDKAFNEIKRIDNLLNVYNEKSEIFKINENASNGFVSATDEVYSLLKDAVSLTEKTNGAFDVTLHPVISLWGIGTENAKVPEDYEIKEALLKTGVQNIEFDDEKKAVKFKKDGMGINLGAFAKGYASDKAVDVLKKSGVKNAVLDLGGNVCTLGKRPLSFTDALRHKSFYRPFTVGIQNPGKNRGEPIEKIIASEDLFIITSGSYERYFEKDGKRYHHIIDPKTGYPAESNIKSATVVTKNGALGDALSTASFILGEDSFEILKPYAEDIILIDEDLNILR